MRILCWLSPVMFQRVCTARDSVRRSGHTSGRRRYRYSAIAAIESSEPRLLLTAGALDPSFGTDGIATVNFGGDDYIHGHNSLAVQPDGRIVMSGSTSSTGSGDFALARFLPAGTLDPSFGTAGRVTSDVGGTDFAPHVILQPDGRIIAVGRSEAVGNTHVRDSAMVRYNFDGTLDATFGTGGIVKMSFHPGLDQFNGAALQSDGKIVTAVLAGFFGTPDNMLVARFNTDGTLDGTFGIGGIATIDFGSTSEFIYGIAVQPADDKIVAVGKAPGVFGADMAVARLTASGILDPTFNGDGKALVNYGSDDFAFDVLIDASDRIVATGGNGGGEATIYRLTPAGDPDPAFGGGDGMASFVFSPTSVFQDVELQADGKLVTVLPYGQPQDMHVVRLDETGALDATFGVGGSAKVSTGPSASEWSIAVAIQPDGSIIVGGATDAFSGPSSRDFVLARLLGDAPVNAAPVISAVRTDVTMLSENDSVVLSGSFIDSDPADVHEVTINWGDGSSQIIVLPTGDRSFAIAHQYLDDGASGSSYDLTAIQVTVMDSAGAMDTASTDVTVHNTAPAVVTIFTNAQDIGSVAVGDTATVSGIFSDVGRLDTHTVLVNWGDGTISSATVVQAAEGGSFFADHVYSRGGLFALGVSVTDDDSGTTGAASQAFVSGTGLSDGTLYFVGQNTSDNVVVRIHGGMIDVNGAQFDPDQVSSITILAGAGNDVIRVQNQIAIPILVDGGPGDDLIDGGTGDDVLLGGVGSDILSGGQGSDILVGGDDADVLFGGQDRDILIGGAGRDVLMGGQGDDLLIAGSTTFDQSISALSLIRQEWNSSNPYAQRVANLRNGSGHVLNGTALSVGATVFDDGISDWLMGNGGQDWFFVKLSGGSNPDWLFDEKRDEELDLF